MISTLILLAIMPRIASSLCECGYSINLRDSKTPVVFMDLLETDFTHDKDISRNAEWIRQQFNVTAEIGRGEYGKSFMPENVISKPVNKVNTKALPPEVAGLDLTVGTSRENNAVPAAEIDSKRLDLHWGSYRAGMKVTDVNGTCAAFFWVYLDPCSSSTNLANC